MKILIVDNEEHDWRRVYVDRELVVENHPGHITLAKVLRACGLEVVEEAVVSFDMVDDE